MASSPAPGVKPGKGPATHNEGDWICSDKNCANVNFSWRANCNKCGKEKGKVDVIKKTGSEIGKQMASRSGGLFSADDWQCSVCGNVNWARRNECNICRTPKFNISEARTGAGGGYNEREGVEYKERDVSDDEYDDFGRKKKKFRKKGSQNGSKKRTTIVHEPEKVRTEELDLSKFPLAQISKPTATVPTASAAARTAMTEETEETEEDDEDDEVDVSKYDLMAGSDDETSQTSSASIPKTSSLQKRKSRSRSPKHRHVSSRSQSSRSRSRSPIGHRPRRRGDRSRSSSPRPRRRSRSHSRTRNKRRSRSKSRSRSPRRRRSGGSKDRGRRGSRSQSRSPTRRRRSHSRSRSRSHSRDRRRSYRSRSRSRDWDLYRS